MHLKVQRWMQLAEECLAQYPGIPFCSMALAEALMFRSTKLRDGGDVASTVTMLERAQRLAQNYGTVLGNDTFCSTPEITESLAKAYYAAGRYAESVPLFEDALHHCEKTNGLSNPETMRQLNNLGVVYQNLGHLQKSKVMVKRAVAVHKQLVAQNETPEAIHLLVVALHNFGTNCLNTEDFATAEEALDDAFLWQAKMEAKSGAGASVWAVLAHADARRLFRAQLLLTKADVFARTEPHRAGSALELLDQAMALYSTAPNQEVQVAQTLLRYGTCHFKLGLGENLALADQHLRRLEAFRQAVPV